MNNRMFTKLPEQPTVPEMRKPPKNPNPDYIPPGCHGCKDVSSFDSLRLDTATAISNYIISFCKTEKSQMTSVELKAIPELIRAFALLIAR